MADEIGELWFAGQYPRGEGRFWLKLSKSGKKGQTSQKFGRNQGGLDPTIACAAYFPRCIFAVLYRNTAQTLFAPIAPLANSAFFYNARPPD